MKRSLIVSGVAALIIAAASVGVAQAQKGSSKNKTHVIYVAAAQATFKPSPMAGVSSGISGTREKRVRPPNRNPSGSLGPWHSWPPFHGLPGRDNRVILTPPDVRASLARAPQSERPASINS
jgi:hypothetical protein